MGADKVLLQFEGEALVVRVARRLALVADPVLLAPGTPDRLGTLGFAEVADAASGAGPLGGLIAGLEASPHPLMAVAAADMPFASPELFRELARLCGGHDAVVPVTSSGPEPLHAVYSRSAIAGLRLALSDGRLALRSALTTIRVREVREEEWRAGDPTGRFALNINRPEDAAQFGWMPEPDLSR
jgi:molybdopterin-guanine dinucleotide biosynthesis protein A